MIEVTLALGVAGFCLLTIFGLLPVGLASNQASIRQTIAGNIASSIVADLHTTRQLGVASTPRYQFNIPVGGVPLTSSSMQTVYIAASGSATVINASPSATASGPSIYRATVFFNTPGQQASQTGGQRNATQVRVLVTWPALSDPVASNGPSNYTGSYDAETALDCN